MRIRINSPTTFVITEQSEKYLETYQFSTPIGEIEVAISSYPEVKFFGHRILLFVRGMNKERDNMTLEVNCPSHMTHIIKALEEFCTFNEEPFEIESCIL